MWVEEEFNHFTQISHNEVNIFLLFSTSKLEIFKSECIARYTNPQSSPVFICIIWRLIQRQQQQLPAIVFKVLEKFNFNTLANHVRTFTDYLIESFQAIGNNQQEAFNYIDFLIRMIWTHVST